MEKKLSPNRGNFRYKQTPADRFDVWASRITLDAELGATQFLPEVGQIREYPEAMARVGALETALAGAGRLDAVYCSDGCRQQAHRKRIKA